LPKNSEKIAKEFSIVSNYTYEETPYESSFAGYKDWYIQEYNKPGYTIEVGNGTSPLPLSDFNKIYEDNKKILTLGLKLA
jgi:g-D-glutamyl-meso-diaminopimelate peptidase